MRWSHGTARGTLRQLGPMVFISNHGSNPNVRALFYIALLKMGHIECGSPEEAP